jgi:hypothetical protein
MTDITGMAAEAKAVALFKKSRKKSEHAMVEKPWLLTRRMA